MYAVVRVNTWDEGKRSAAARDVAEFDRIHAEQPGFVGSLVVALGAGREAVVNLWDTEAQATAALPAVGPAVDLLLRPLMDEPSELLGTGEVVRGAELVRRDPHAS